ncbi:DUF5615 family PIN-like protein [Amycolatopsis magusensis]|uniref:DUF5615 family PIN-like protein n=1 Tax=Amycolatopsis magusensis TaxID=882444 RepID=UPI0037BA787E
MSAPDPASTTADPAAAGCAAEGAARSVAAQQVSAQGAAYQAVVDPQAIGAEKTVSHDGAELRIGAAAVATRTTIGITPLADAEVPSLDPGMTNVTRGPRHGYRFSPHPFHFAEKVKVSLPYDPAVVGKDFETRDVHTFYYDEAGGCWRQLERVAVDEENHVVVSLTDHFTDMINAVVTVPDAPEGESFDPTRIKDIQAADPGASISTIAAPSADTSGDARLAYPIELPPGRDGMAPQLDVRYSSVGENGWLGQGWDLPVPSITVDTRWGVPRYDPALETETYRMGGEQLTPVAHRETPVPRSAGKVFHPRIESGQFAQILRHGESPAAYHWEIVDKSGTRSTYGGTPESTLTDSGGNVFQWALREVRDVHGNLIRYTTARQADFGVPSGGSLPGSELYLERVTYTGSGETDGPYAVDFVRDRELGEPRRTDVGIDARGGFKRVTADLLRKIVVTFNGQPVRHYDLNYGTGAFEKTLLKSVSQFGANGTLFNTHEFAYHDDIRDSGGGYQAFSRGDWASPGDNLRTGAIPGDPGAISALGGSTGDGAGGHLYVGAGPFPSKSGSTGVKTGYASNTDTGLLALVDVDGDNLADKVFQQGGGVAYRKNLARPGGQARFADEVEPLNIPGIAFEASDSLTLGVESYVGGVAAQLNHVDTFTTSDRYFTDVNADGLTDLVSDGNVLFGRIGAGGAPVFGSSSETPVPIGEGQVDTNGLLDDFAEDRARKEETYPPLDTLRRWVAPFDGTVSVSGPVSLTPPDLGELPLSSEGDLDGVRVAVQHEDTELWSKTIEAGDHAQHTPSGVGSLQVSKGQRLYFRVGSRADGAADAVAWDPVITYAGADREDVNELDTHRYQASADFTLGGQQSTLEAPVTGTMRLGGDLVKKAATTDDIGVLITRDGAPIFEQSLASTAVGEIPVNLDVPVTKGQKLQWRVEIDSPIDLSRFEWVPTVAYTAAEGVQQITDAAGEFTLTASPPYALDMYPVNQLGAPQELWTAPQTGALTIEPRLTLGDPKPARVVATVKKRGALLGKKVLDLTGEPEPFTVDVVAGDQLSFDFSTLDAVAVPSWGMTAGGVEVPAGFHTGECTSCSGVFQLPYRGWGAVGYNAKGDRATKPVVQGDLKIDESYQAQLPVDVVPERDRPAFEADPKITPPPVYPFTPSPQTGRWGAGDDSWVEKSAASSSRMGGRSVDLPKSSDYAGAKAPSRVARSKQTSLTVGAGEVGTVGGSIAYGTSTAEVDYLDMNGDSFPDVVSGGKIQFTDEHGVLGASSGTHPGTDVRESTTISGNANAGSAARVIATGKSHATPPANGTAGTAQSGNDLPPFGVGGNLGAGEQNARFDLLDMNGDGLPDRVFADGRVTLNLGWKFAEIAEPWPGAGLHDGEMTNLGVSLGFNTDFYGFAGGASLNQGRNSAEAGLVDVNGDGLLDRVFDGDPIKVSMNTGSGFGEARPFHGSLSGVNLDQNARLSAGAYFSFSFCFTFGACVITNPGADASTGAARTEQMLRDINGDGYADHLRSTKDDQLQVAQNNTGRTNLLRTVDNPLGGRIELDYSRDGNTYDNPKSHWLLARVSVDDGLPGDGQDRQLATYKYEGAFYDRFEREFFGYRKVTEEHRDPGAGDALYRATTKEYLGGYHLRGAVQRETTADAAGRLFAETRYTYQPKDVLTAKPVTTAVRAASVWPQPVRTDRYFHEGQAKAVKSTYTEVAYDDVGNVIRRFDPGEPGPQDDVEVLTRFSRELPECAGNRVLDTPFLTDTLGNKAVMRHQESDVDCATGDALQHRALLANGDQAVTDVTYDDVGNVASVTGPPNKFGQRYRLDYTYDAATATHTESVTDSFGYRSTKEQDLRFGLPASEVDQNGQEVRTAYDEFGRVDAVTGPYELAEGRTTIDFEYHPEAAVPFAITRHLDRAASGVRADTIDTITFADGLNRIVQTKKDATLHTAPGSAAVAGMTVSGRTDHDFAGRATAVHHPTSEPKGAHNTTYNAVADPVQPTRSSFDVLDRNTKTVLPDNTATTASYGFGADRLGLSSFETVTKNANGVEKRSYHNVRDQVTTVKESNPEGGQPVIFTSYAYDPLGQLLRVTDDRNNTTHSAYDNFGRRTLVDNPDTGRTETQYDLADNPVREITANLGAIGRAVDYDYEFTRLSGIRYPVFPANNVTYTYGAPGAPDNGAARITGVKDGAGTVSRGYGPLGEVVREVRTTVPIDGDTRMYTTQYTFDSFNRVLKMTFPDGELLTYGYNSGGLVETASGVKGKYTYQYLKKLEYDRFEQRALQENGNGTKTSYTYDGTDRRLESLESKQPKGKVFQKLGYDYDDTGNVTALRNEIDRSEVGGPATQTFGYDDLDRLTSAAGQFTGKDGKADKYQLDMSYDTLHNVTVKDQRHQIGSHAQKETTYSYGYTYNSGHPHAPSGIAAQEIRYDANGNLVQRSEGKEHRQQVWDDENRLACTHDGKSPAIPQVADSCAPGASPTARFAYDDQGERVLKDGGHESVNVYPNAGFSQRIGDHSTTSFKHIFAGGARLVTKVGRSSGEENQRFFHHPDHLGSTGVATDEDGAISDHHEYFPSGESWVNQRSSGAVPYQFGGKELDAETGLYYFGARYYEPKSTNWQSADPLLPSYLDGKPNGGAEHPANLATHSYAYNNPVRYGDPDGKAVWFFLALFLGGTAGGSQYANAPRIGEQTYTKSDGRLALEQVEGAGTVVGATYGAKALYTGGRALLTRSGLAQAGKEVVKDQAIDQAVEYVAGEDGSSAYNAASSLGRARSELVSQLVKRTGDLAGFTGKGTKLIIDENFSKRGLAPYLRSKGYDARSVEEMGLAGQKIPDDKVKMVAEAVGAKVVSKDRGRNFGGGFGGIQIKLPERVKSDSDVLRLIEEALKKN